MKLVFIPVILQARPSIPSPGCSRESSRDRSPLWACASCLGTELKMSEADVHEALLLALTLSDRTWNKYPLVPKVGHVIHPYHWFTHILQPTAAHRCVLEGLFYRPGCAICCNQTPACASSPVFWIPCAWSGLWTQATFRFCQPDLPGTDAHCLGSLFCDAEPTAYPLEAGSMVSNPQVPRHSTEQILIQYLGSQFNSSVPCWEGLPEQWVLLRNKALESWTRARNNKRWPVSSSVHTAYGLLGCIQCPLTTFQYPTSFFQSDSSLWPRRLACLPHHDSLLSKTDSTQSNNYSKIHWSWWAQVGSSDTY